jgi:Na+-translocating ferredoxin:NAD+ oxidoreductase subunit G
MKSTLNLILVLTVICLVAGLLLGVVNVLTAEPIAAAQREEKLAAIRTVLPPFNNTPDTDTVTVEEAGRAWTFFVGRLDGVFSGAAFTATSPNGYGGPITVMVGVDAARCVNAVVVLSQKETPGLGARIADEDFRAQFAGRSIADTAWAVRQDQGDIDAVTAATISSRAVVAAVKAGLDVYSAHAARMAAPSPLDPPRSTPGEH